MWAPRCLQALTGRADHQSLSESHLGLTTAAVSAVDFGWYGTTEATSHTRLPKLSMCEQRELHFKLHRSASRTLVPVALV